GAAAAAAVGRADEPANPQDAGAVRPVEPAALGCGVLPPRGRVGAAGLAGPGEVPGRPGRDADPGRTLAVGGDGEGERGADSARRAGWRKPPESGVAAHRERRGGRRG